MIILFSWMDTDIGFYRYLPPICNDGNCHPVEDVFIVCINRNDDLLIESYQGYIDSLCNQVKEFISNPNDDYNLSYVKMREIPLLGKCRVSHGNILLQWDRGTSYKGYINVMNEIERAFNELRDELAVKKFNRHYKNLTSEQKSAIRKAIPLAIIETEPAF